ncbi:Hsp20/alpha crystallin family protein [Hyphomonas sp.]|uniref:Hsp20/alpha crystallin family protein n=1 Tax=Hyphomonas sp. TaxID=87 RepID=UPI000C5BCD49|nr:Hsp20/alpha crystallin family protein [Hyphomonas sp.]MAB10849.1 heat-shock protein Hsp20 [Hyphomonas sp.]MAU67979.1 heat-shock protein Hsp20 [Hyphomonas sp.]MBM59702.1 heat-shock protein Hsp20 [Hyphomonas sp.]
MNTSLSPFEGFSPFAEMRRLQADMNRLFGATSRRAASFPAVNIYQNDDALLLTAELPGLSEEAIDLSVFDDEITLSASIEDAEDDSVHWYRRERPRGRFSRTISLPFRVDPEQVEARFQNGVLEIEVKRPEDEKPRRIAING